jgi:putative heme-binding domain-containing protein
MAKLRTGEIGNGDMEKPNRLKWWGLLGGLLLATAALPAAQKLSDTLPPGKNPHLGNQASLRAGLALYRVSCGDCHGLDATGYRGPDLTTVLGGMADERLFQTIRKGVPGTEMQPSKLPDDSVLMITAYLRNLNASEPVEKPIGNVENGAKLFAAQCTTCHRVGDSGGRLGPDLSRVGAARSRSALVREIRTPSEWVPPAYETVTLVTKDGQKIRAVKKNEDVFSIQVMDTRERIQGYLKSNLQEVIYEKVSLMPAYGADRLSDGDLNDLVGYLTTLRKAPASAR